jgi:hypothetical protein
VKCGRVERFVPHQTILIARLQKHAVLFWSRVTNPARKKPSLDKPCFSRRTRRLALWLAISATVSSVKNTFRIKNRQVREILDPLCGTRGPILGDLRLSSCTNCFEGGFSETTTRVMPKPL